MEITTGKRCLNLNVRRPGNSAYGSSSLKHLNSYEEAMDYTKKSIADFKGTIEEFSVDMDTMSMPPGEFAKFKDYVQNICEDEFRKMQGVKNV